MQVRTGTALVGAAGIVYTALPLAAEIPRTDHGKPGFSGSYDIASLTRMERAPDLGVRTYTVEKIDR